MRINEETVLVGRKVVLVPYRKEHVQQYNTWMQSPTLQEQTASEPLTLAEEYEMQQSWWLDDDKLTFIILAKPSGDRIAEGDDDADATALISKCRMIGDVNVFLSDPEDCDDGDDQNGTSKRGELEIMIAEPDYRRKGCASEALQLLLWYITAPDSPTSHAACPSALPLHPTDLFLKISMDNQPSIAMFKKLGFREFKVSEVFQEVELRLQDSKVLATEVPQRVSQWKASP